MAIELSRQALYERVWSEPMQRLSKQFGLSDVALAKTCRRWNIPVPPRGYWAKVQAGKRVNKPPLPADLEGRLASNLHFPHPPKTTTPATPTPEPKHPLIAAEVDETNTISVPDQLKLRHPLLRSTREAWRIVDRKGYQWGAPLPQRFNMSISKKMRARALRILQSLFRALESRGHGVEKSDDGSIIAIVLGERCELVLRERQRQMKHDSSRAGENKSSAQSHSPYGLFHSGELELRVERRFSRPSTFRDKKNRPLEMQLNDVVAALLEAALAEKSYRSEQEKQRLAQIERARLRAIEQERARREKARAKSVNSWFQAAERHKRLVAFVAELKESIGPVDNSSELGLWLDWAIKYADDGDVLRKFRERKQSIRLYHCIATYAADQVIRNGFQPQGPSFNDDQEAPAAVTVTDVPMQGTYGGTVCLVVDLPEEVAQPYEQLMPDRGYREFGLPADVINGYPRQLDSGERRLKRSDQSRAAGS